MTRYSIGGTINFREEDSNVWRIKQNIEILGHMRVKLEGIANFCQYCIILKLIAYSNRFDYINDTRLNPG